MTAQEAESIMIYIEQLEAQLMAMKKYILELVEAETTSSITLNEQDTTTAKSPDQD
jgi:hypothetical protein